MLIAPNPVIRFGVSIYMRLPLSTLTTIHHERPFEVITCRWKCFFLANRFVVFATSRHRGGLRVQHDSSRGNLRTSGERKVV